jgi:hypothetical protein
LPRVYNVNAPELRGIAIVGNSLLAVGEAGTILEMLPLSFRPRFRPWETRFLADGSFAIAADAAPGATLAIETTTDLRRWASAQIVTNWVGRGEIIDPEPGVPMRFYRARTPVAVPEPQ